jgi:hypothetical protein
MKIGPEPFAEDRSLKPNPRTLQQAFGPYTSSDLCGMPSERSWRLSDVAIATLLAIVVIGVLWGVL